MTEINLCKNRITLLVVSKFFIEKMTQNFNLFIPTNQTDDDEDDDWSEYEEPWENEEDWEDEIWDDEEDLEDDEI